MNQSQIASVMVALPVPLQLLPPTLVLPCFHVVVLQFAAAKQLDFTNSVFAKDGSGEALFFSHSSQNKLPCHQVSAKQARKRVFRRFYSPRVFAPGRFSLWLFTFDNICSISKIHSANFGIQGGCRMLKMNKRGGFFCTDNQLLPIKN